MCKVIESVLQHEPNMPTTIVRQLARLEEIAIESLVWQRDSPLWRQLESTPLSREAVRQLCALPSSSLSTTPATVLPRSINTSSSTTTFSTAVTYATNTNATSTTSTAIYDNSTAQIPQALMVEYFSRSFS